ncbi:Holliday junction branch migration protein RuvA [soil metagenome]
MIALLRGEVAHLRAGEVILEVSGVGYRVRVPTGARLAGVGQGLVLHTHLAVREDAMDLYGFPEADDRDLFTVLLTVSGIGPRIALAAVDTLGATGLRSAVVTDDVTALTAIPGVGRKGAQRMVLELRSKIGTLPGADGGPGLGDPPAAGVPTDAKAQARLALASLGYGAAEVEYALRGVAAAGTPEEMIRTALRGLAS